MRLVRFTTGWLVLLAAPLAFGQKFDGTWKAGLTLNGQRCIFSLVMGPGERYSELLRCGALMTRQSGTYVFSNSVLMRTVIDWDPKRRYVLDNGYSGHWEQNAKPPGGSFRVKFTTPDIMVWQDVNFGGTITYKRSTQ